MINWIEEFNELAFVLIMYTMLGFAVSEGPGILSVYELWVLGYIAIALIVVVYAINFVFMIYVHLKRIKIYRMERIKKQRIKKLRSL